MTSFSSTSIHTYMTLSHLISMCSYMTSSSLTSIHSYMILSWLILICSYMVLSRVLSWLKIMAHLPQLSPWLLVNEGQYGKRECLCMYICMHVCRPLCTCVCMYVCMHVCTRWDGWMSRASVSHAERSGNLNTDSSPDSAGSSPDTVGLSPNPTE